MPKISENVLFVTEKYLNTKMSCSTKSPCSIIENHNVFVMLSSCICFGFSRFLRQIGYCQVSILVIVIVIIIIIKKKFFIFLFFFIIIFFIRLFIFLFKSCLMKECGLLLKKHSILTNFHLV